MAATLDPMDSQLTTPSIAIRTVILADLRCRSANQFFEESEEYNTGCPLPLSNVRTPFLPVSLTLSILLQALFFFREILMMVYLDHDDDLALPIGASRSVGNVLVEAVE